MYKKILFVLLAAVSLSACKNSLNNVACGTQVCTDEFAYLGITIKAGTDTLVAVSNIKVVNLRTNKEVERPLYPPNVDFVRNTVLIADDSTKNQFSSAGDDVQITATNTKTNQTKSITIKISGKCNCHVAKVSGPDELVFD